MVWTVYYWDGEAAAVYRDGVATREDAEAAAGPLAGAGTVCWVEEVRP